MCISERSLKWTSWLSYNLQLEEVKSFLVRHECSITPRKCSCGVNSECKACICGRSEVSGIDWSSAISQSRSGSDIGLNFEDSVVEMALNDSIINPYSIGVVHKNQRRKDGPFTGDFVGKQARSPILSKPGTLFRFGWTQNCLVNGNVLVWISADNYSSTETNYHKTFRYLLRRNERAFKPSTMIADCITTNNPE